MATGVTCTATEETVVFHLNTLDNRLDELAQVLDACFERSECLSEPALQTAPTAFDGAEPQRIPLLGRLWNTRTTIERLIGRVDMLATRLSRLG